MGRILLIGGAGFIGAHLARELSERGRDVVVLDDDRAWTDDDEAAVRARAWRRRTLLRDADLRHGAADDPLALAEVLTTTPPDAVVHLANLPLVAVADRDPARARAAIVGTTAAVVAAVARHAPHARLTYVSSSMVYGDFVRDPQPETARLAPREPYGQAKLDAERLVRDSWTSWTIVRPSAVYGPGDGHRRFITRLVEAAVDEHPLRLTADPDVRLDFTHVADVARGLADAALSPAAERGTFNLAAGRARSLVEAIDAVRALGFPVAVEPVVAPAVRPRRGTLDIAHARDVLGYAPRFSLEAGLAAHLDVALAPA
ncbi:UDP-glucose 4-epimerase/UDP-glucuronate 4-epimerase [Solirubrobacter pauli]|uniref:UDP-glucose 4-epimerase/UDP-glucuronate 4-epimerase n=1 Tax=Solirubrobacter pauli TaxID=166793 RepID=A0A660L5H1_9ACTN|nr:NAD(P)-dependent oxidoreductase [Solirubrobacter pauli]RKQ90248.1 UDP-glucose 4-epimerase/UDP-glucuronate 4-epimerase [Solirubrobacter pauli]